MTYSKRPSETMPTLDPVVNVIIQKLVDRHKQGMLTYGVSMADNPLSTEQWINHAIEEALDFACYLERLKSSLTAP